MWATNRLISRFSSLALLAVLTAGCSVKDTVTPPERLLSEREMIEILTDANIIEGALNFRRSEGEDTHDLSLAYYEQLFEHYGINDSIFLDNLRYYTEKPATLERITDSVYIRLTKEQDKIRRGE